MMMPMPSLQVVAQLGAERIVNSLPEGLLVAGFAWLVLRLARRQNSGTRYWVWFVALLGIAAIALVPAARAGVSGRSLRPEVVLPAAAAVAIFYGWAVMAALALLRLLVGMFRLRELRRSLVPLGAADLDPALRDVASLERSGRTVSICRSGEVRVPTAVGFFRPTIVIPEWALRELPVEELKILVLHEFAHLQRWDDWTNLAQKFVRSLFFFHPAVWWIERRLSLEREMACDDAVLERTRNPRAYAECLVALAEKGFAARGLALAQAAIGRAGETSRRVAQILDGNRLGVTRVFKPALLAMTAFAGICFVVLPGAPRLVAFEESGDSFASSSASAASTAAAMSSAVLTPAKLQTGSDSGRLTATVIRPSARLPRGSAHRFRASAPTIMVAKHEAAGPSVELVTVAVAKPNAPAPQWLLVVQTAQYDGQGSAAWTLSVWRVTVSSSRGNVARAETIPKKI